MAYWQCHFFASGLSRYKYQREYERLGVAHPSWQQKKPFRDGFFVIIPFAFIFLMPVD
jgi:hypothetical protein